MGSDNFDNGIHTRTFTTVGEGASDRPMVLGGGGIGTFSVHYGSFRLRAIYHFRTFSSLRKRALFSQSVWSDLLRWAVLPSNFPNSFTGGVTVVDVG